MALPEFSLLPSYHPACVFVLWEGRGTTNFTLATSPRSAHCALTVFTDSGFHPGGCCCCEASSAPTSPGLDECSRTYTYRSSMVSGATAEVLEEDSKLSTRFDEANRDHILFVCVCMCVCVLCVCECVLCVWCITEAVNL